MRRAHGPEGAVGAWRPHVEFRDMARNMGNAYESRAGYGDANPLWSDRAFVAVGKIPP